MKNLIIILLSFLSVSAGAQVTLWGAKDNTMTNSLNIGNGLAKATIPGAYLEIGPATGGTKGVLLARGDKSLVTNPVTGLLIFDQPTQKFWVYVNSQWEPITATLGWSAITGKPTTLAGYGITDPVLLSTSSYSNPLWLTDLAWSKIIGQPTTLAGYGITDPVVLSTGSYVNPSWITSLPWSKITSTPTTFAGYGLTGRQAMGGPLTLWNSATNPSSPVNGDIWYRTTDHSMLLYSNGTWVGLLSTGSSQYIQNQTGATQAAGFKVNQFSYLDGGFSAGSTSSSISVGTTNAGIFLNHQLQLRYSGSVAANRGPSLAFRINDGSDNNRHVGGISMGKVNATSGNGAAYMAFGVHDGTSLYEAVDINYDGDIEVKTAGKGVILKSPDGTRYKLTMANGGTLTTTAL